MGILSRRPWVALCIVMAICSGVVVGEAIERMSALDMEHALESCGFVQELNEYRKTTAPETSSTMQKLFEVLFPYGPALNALLATLYISGPPNLLLAFCPSNIDPSSLTIMVAFAVGGLLGDTIFHLLPEIFLGEAEPDRARFVLVEPNKNLLLGVAILVGFVTFVAMDKTLRIATGGQGHDHGHRLKSEDSPRKEDSTSATSSGAQKSIEANGSVRSRKSAFREPEILSEAKPLILPNDVIRKLWSIPEPNRTNRWLAETLEQDEDSGVTQIALWKAYETTFGGNAEVPILEATLLIHNASKVFEKASAQIIDSGAEKKFIIRGVRPKDGGVKQAAKDAKKALVKAATPDVPGREASQSIRLSAYLNLIADFTHNITDGLALSSSFYASPMLGATTTVAVFFHEIPHEVGDFALLIQSGFSKRRAMGAQFVTAVGAFLGTCLGIAIQELGKTDASTNTSDVTSKGLMNTGLGWGDLLLPFTAGTFLYVGTVAVIPELLETGPDKRAETRKTLGQFVAMFVGAGIMLWISWS